MSIPRQLVKSFEIIRDCKLVVTKDPTDDNLKEFGKAMNNAIPEPSNQISFMIYKFMRGMYLTNKEKFLSLIDGMRNYEAMILWTDYDDILRSFELNNVIFLGWNKSVNKYQAARIDPKKKPFSNDMESEYENKKEFRAQPKKIKTKPQFTFEEEKKTNEPNVNLESELQKVNQFEQEDEDQDIIMRRIAEAQQAYKPTESDKNLLQSLEEKQPADDSEWNQRIEEQRMNEATKKSTKKKLTKEDAEKIIMRLIKNINQSANQDDQEMDNILQRIEELQKKFDTTDNNNLSQDLEEKQLEDDNVWDQRIEEQRMNEAKKKYKTNEEAEKIIMNRIDNVFRSRNVRNNDNNILQRATEMQDGLAQDKEDNQKETKEDDTILQQATEMQERLDQEKKAKEKEEKEKDDLIMQRALKMQENLDKQRKILESKEGETNATILQRVEEMQKKLEEKLQAIKDKQNSGDVSLQQDEEIQES